MYIMVYFWGIAMPPRNRTYVLVRKTLMSSISYSNYVKNSRIQITNFRSRSLIIMKYKITPMIIIVYLHFPKELLNKTYRCLSCSKTYLLRLFLAYIAPDSDLLESNLNLDVHIWHAKESNGTVDLLLRCNPKFRNRQH